MVRNTGDRRGAASVEGDCYRAGFPPNQLSRINWKSSISPSFRGAAFRGIATAWLSLWFKVAIDQRLLPRGSPRKPETWPHAAFRSSSASSLLCGFLRNMKENRVKSMRDRALTCALRHTFSNSIHKYKTNAIKFQKLFKHIIFYLFIKLYFASTTNSFLRRRREELTYSETELSIWKHKMGKKLLRALCFISRREQFRYYILPQLVKIRLPLRAKSA